MCFVRIGYGSGFNISIHFNPDNVISKKLYKKYYFVNTGTQLLSFSCWIQIWIRNVPHTKVDLEPDPGGKNNVDPSDTDLDPKYTRL